eukprot:TRINITY_DN63670_c0_g1_i1.p1 TRINITY_DN63670_c0_g1~~TRINITY_DN63670_c0_g1_i1.p1  ORF type:complete len:554 (+),score=59.85 TRINITY_DN63670_c0_g1_i1:230-1663(+)
MILNQHALSDFDLPDLKLSMATKIRKCWHQDFPESLQIKVPGAPQPDESQIMPNGQRYDPCQDGFDYSGMEGYAGYKPGPGTGRGAGRGRSAGTSLVGGYSARGHEPSSYSGMPMSSPRPVAAKSASIPLEHVRAALDCIAERADLNRQDVYLWVHDVMPDEIWQQLWDSYSADLVRQRTHASAISRNTNGVKGSGHGNTRSNVSGEGYPSRPQSNGREERTAPSYHGREDLNVSFDDRVQNYGREDHAYASQYGRDDYPPSRGPHSARGDYAAAPHSARQDYVAGPRSQSRPCYDRDDYGPEDDELSQLPELKSRLQRQFGTSDRDDSQSIAPSYCSQAESMTSNAISAWLGTDMARGAMLTPVELADWLRTLPRDRLEDESLKGLARHVLDAQLDEEQFEAMLAEGRLSSMGITDVRQQKVIERYFRQRQKEAVMAETAKQTGALNRHLSVQQAGAGAKPQMLDFGKCSSKHFLP